MKKTLFEKACNVREGILESRMVTREETEHRPLTDEETRSELKYLLETIPYAGLEPETEKEIIKACRYLLK